MSKASKGVVKVPMYIKEPLVHIVMSENEVKYERDQDFRVAVDPIYAHLRRLEFRTTPQHQSSTRADKFKKNDIALERFSMDGSQKSDIIR